MLISLLYHYARFPWNIPIEKEELLSAPLFINLLLLFEIRLYASAKFLTADGSSCFLRYDIECRDQEEPE